VNFLVYLSEISRLISSSVDSTVRIWDRDTFDCLHVLKNGSPLSRRFLYLGDFVPFTSATSVAIKPSEEEEDDEYDDESFVSSNDEQDDSSNEDGNNSKNEEGKATDPTKNVKIRPPKTESKSTKEI